MQHHKIRVETASEIANAMAGSGWAVDFTQLARGPETASLIAAATESVRVMRLDLANRTQQRALPPGADINFGIPVRPQASGRFGRRALLSESINILDAEGGMDAVSEAGFSVFTLSINAERLSAFAAATRLQPSFSLTGKGSSQFLPEPTALGELRRVLQQFVTAPEDQWCRANETIAATDICFALLQALGGSTEPEYVPASSRCRALKRALTRIHDQPKDEALTVASLCSETGSSLSTLERAFKEQFDLSPKKYLTALRLNGARRDLISLRDDSVATIASNWGFWHMSKFASDYRLMFGETPSQTRSRVASRS